MLRHKPAGVIWARLGKHRAARKKYAKVFFMMSLSLR